jgi:hypothetical protein
MFGLSPKKAKTEFDVTLRPNRVTAQAFGRGLLPAIDAFQYGEKPNAATHDGVEMTEYSRNSGGALPLPLGEGWGEGLRSIDSL